MSAREQKIVIAKSKEIREAFIVIVANSTMKIETVKAETIKTRKLSGRLGETK